ncbi:MAG: DUF2333 family protein, partial [Oricola sp.]
MLDPIIAFFTRVFEYLGRAVGHLIAWLLWPFLALGRWYTRKGWILKTVVGGLIVGLIAFYGYFIFQTQYWANFDPDYPKGYSFAKTATLAGDPLPAGSATTQVATETNTAPETNAASAGSVALGSQQTAQAGAPAGGGACHSSDIVTVAADLVDFNVNQNRWISSMLASKLGFFGIPWKNTPFLDNKAAFQLGINQVLRRTTTELVDTLGRVRGTSQIDQNLQDARTALAYPEDTWYISTRGPVQATPSRYRQALGHLRAFNEDLGACQASFDARADNMMQFLDRVAGDIGSTSDILRSRIEQSNAGWFDPRADDRFWFAYGQLYAYYGVLQGARSDFAAIIQERNLAALWDRMQEQLRSALNMQPLIVSNGQEASFIFPSHLATMGFYLLRVRSNL